MMLMIATLRERTFREIGEGTKNEIDTDRFDPLITGSCSSGTTRRCGWSEPTVWDWATRSCGNYGLKGFYTHTLFRMSPPMGEGDEPHHRARSFVHRAREYQRKPASLMLLWKGILHVLLQNEQYRYLMGPVTVSGGFQHTSKLIIAAYVQSFHLDRKKASYIRPRTGIVVPARIDESLIAEVRPIELINKIICDIERNAFSIPVLIRKYLQLNSSARIQYGSRFCDSLDALMLLDLRRVPEEILMLSKERPTST